MIYGDAILEQQLNSLIKSPMEIMQEYYENEISMLEATIEYHNERMLVTESTELELLQEGFIENTKKKIKELIEKLIDWTKKIFKNLKNIIKNITEKRNSIKKIQIPTDTNELIKFAVAHKILKVEDDKISIIEFDEYEYAACCKFAFVQDAKDTKEFVTKYANTLKYMYENAEMTDNMYDELQEMYDTLYAINGDKLIINGKEHMVEDYVSIKSIKKDQITKEKIQKIVDDDHKLLKELEDQNEFLIKFGEDEVRKIEKCKPDADHLNKIGTPEVDINNIVHIYNQIITFYTKTINKYIKYYNKAYSFIKSRY